MTRTEEIDTALKKAGWSESHRIEVACLIALEREACAKIADDAELLPHCDRETCLAIARMIRGQSGQTGSVS